MTQDLIAFRRLSQGATIVAALVSGYLVYSQSPLVQFAQSAMYLSLGAVFLAGGFERQAKAVMPSYVLAYSVLSSGLFMLAGALLALALTRHQ